SLPGFYTVTLAASNAAGTSTRAATVTVSGSHPVANFTFSPSSPSAGQLVQLTDTSSGAPTGWSWNFGDPGSGASNTSASQNPTHVFALPGVYTVTLAASNAAGTNTRTTGHTVGAPPPVANFTFSPSSPSAGQLVQFTDTSSGAPTG